MTKLTEEPCDCDVGECKGARVLYCIDERERAAPDSTRTGQVGVEDEPVATVLWYDPAAHPSFENKPRKIIDASMAFMGAAEIGTKLYARPLAARPAAPEAQGVWIKTPERFVIAVKEFLADWRKGDFSLPKLAELDAESIEAALEDWASRLPAPPASSGQESA